jgi:hypothetical protein
MSRISIRIAVLIVATALANVVRADNFLVWTARYFSAPELMRANVDGSNIQNVLPADPDPNALSLVVDPRDGTIFYGNYAAEYTIKRVGPDGTNNQTLFHLDVLPHTTGPGLNTTPTPWSMSLDTIHNKLYWLGGQNQATNLTTTYIVRSNLDGTNVEIVKQGSSDQFSPQGLAVDGNAGKVYWADITNNAIRVANLDGTGEQNLYALGAGSYHPFALAIDFNAQRMFWTENNSGILARVKSATLSGTDVQTIYTNMTFSSGLALDTANHLLYAVDTNRILRMNYDGSNAQVLISPANGVTGIALTAVPELPTGQILVIGTLLAAACLIRRSHSGVFLFGDGSVFRPDRSEDSKP